MAPRANWKGFLQLADLSCPVALFTAASTADRVRFHTINRATGNRVSRQFVDSETGNVVPAEDQVKGYEIAPGDFIPFEDEELAAAIPQGDKTLAVKNFVPLAEADSLFLDNPYYLAPADAAGTEAFCLIRDALAAEKTLALADAVLFRRERTLAIRAHEGGLLAHTLRYDHEVKARAAVFADIPDLTIGGEMLDLARHIITTKAGHFDPAGFHDRYDDALAAMVKARIAGRPLPTIARARDDTVVDLLTALRHSAGASGAKAGAGTAKAGKSKAKTGKGKAAAPQRKAG